MRQHNRLGLANQKSESRNSDYRLKETKQSVRESWVAGAVPAHAGSVKVCSVEWLHIFCSDFPTESSLSIRFSADSTAYQWLICALCLPLRQLPLGFTYFICLSKCECLLARVGLRHPCQGNGALTSREITQTPGSVALNLVSNSQNASEDTLASVQILKIRVKTLSYFGLTRSQ